MTYFYTIIINQKKQFKKGRQPINSAKNKMCTIIGKVNTAKRKIQEFSEMKKREIAKITPEGKKFLKEQTKGYIVASPDEMRSRGYDVGTGEKKMIWSIWFSPISKCYQAGWAGYRVKTTYEISIAAL